MSTSTGAVAARRHGKARLVGVLLLCAPSVLGTLGLSTLTILGTMGVSASDGTVLSAFGASAVILFLMGTYGPILIVGAAPLAFGVSRRVGMRSRLSVAGWTSIVVALFTTAVFYWWLTFAADLP